MNSKYAQVAGLLAQGRLAWASDNILACLVTNGIFDPSHKTLSQVGAAQHSTPIYGRFVTSDGDFMGNAAVFQGVTGSTTYQLVVVQTLNVGDPNVLAWYDTDENYNPLTVDNTGSLLLRPSLLDPYLDPTRVWMSV